MKHQPVLTETVNLQHSFLGLQSLLGLLHEYAASIRVDTADAGIRDSRFGARDDKFMRAITNHILVAACR